MNTKKELEELSRYTVKCPICKTDMLIRDYKYNIPFYGDILISTGQCEKCRYVYRDVILLSGGEPRKIVFRVEEPRDLGALVIKSSSCIIEIPELGAKIEPGLYSQGFITTVEGLIHDLMDALKIMCREESVNRDRCNEVEIVLSKAMNGEIKYTVIMYDHMGICDIISPNKRPLYEKLE